MARRAMDHLAAAGFGPFKISVVVTRHNVDQLDGFKALADSLRRPAARHPAAPERARRRHLARPAPDQRPAAPDLRLAAGQRRDVLTGDSFFHLNALGEPLPGLNMCGAGRVVCLIDPIGDVYACPFVIHDEFRAGTVRDAGGFADVWRQSDLFRRLREPQSAGACASLRQLRRLPGRLHGGQVLHRSAARRARPRVRAAATASVALARSRRPVPRAVPRSPVRTPDHTPTQRRRSVPVA